jgi:hypothetical protein
MKLNIQKFAIALTDTVNYSGMLYAKTDETTRFLDAIYSRGKNGGKTTVYSTEFVLSSGYELADPTQPAISEEASLEAPTATTVERTQEYNVAQIFQKAVSVSYMKQSNRDALAGVNNANAVNGVANELDFQIGKQIAQIKLDLNYTALNGAYQYTKGSTSIAPKTRGLLNAITSNVEDANGAELTKKMVNDLLVKAISNGANVGAMEIWANPADLDVITDVYTGVAGSTLPASRTQGGVAYSEVLTQFGVLPINWDSKIPSGTLLFANMGEIAIAEKPYFNENGEELGVLFYESLAKVGASENGQIYGELGLDYSSERLHAKIVDFATTEVETA